MFRRILKTNNDYFLTIARLILGVVFFAHGAQKMQVAVTAAGRPGRGRLDLIGRAGRALARRGRLRARTTGRTDRCPACRVAPGRRKIDGLGRPLAQLETPAPERSHPMTAHVCAYVVSPPTSSSPPT